MQIGTRHIDHMVYCVPHLDSAIEHFKKAFGIEASIGGQHLLQGTHNAIIKVGPASYLELIAADPSNLNIQTSRWMGVDLISEPRLTRWCLASQTISRDIQDLQNYNTQLGEIVEGQRMTTSNKLLKWQMSKPLSTPLIEPAPFLIDWSKSSTHPVKNLTQVCTLESIEIQCMNNLEVEKLFEKWDLKKYYTEADSNSIKARFIGPKGPFSLS